MRSLRNQNQMDQAEHALRAANIEDDVEWTAALKQYRSAVRQSYMAAAVTEIENLNGALTRTKRQVDVLAEVRDQLREDLEFYQEKLAERVVEIRAGRAAAQEVLMWTSCDVQVASAAHHILEQLPDPDLEDDAEQVDERHAECGGLHYSRKGVTDCDDKPM
ncbi:hypothetical protein AB0C84_44440 [Actinomadura sp. NPDC048955]|uniref:hypothetical protein n=1 Tax=Actinomadura sp. NPDC048955 TaxID=3158228 RepID=UPI0033EDD9FF